MADDRPGKGSDPVARHKLPDELLAGEPAGARLCRPVPASARALPRANIASSASLTLFTLGGGLHSKAPLEFAAGHSQAWLNIVEAG